MDEPWYIFKENAPPHDDIDNLPEAPKWRQFKGRDARRYRGKLFQVGDREAQMVNTALFLRRPLLITGSPGTGKSSLAYAVQYQLKLDEVLYWPITTRTTLQDGLYAYDAIGRLQETEIHRDKSVGDETEESREPKDIGRYITLGPMGTALIPSKRPRVLLIDEIDKSDIDLPNDLLNVFEEGGFSIPELKRLVDREAPVTVMTCDDKTAEVKNGEIVCQAFPFIVLTSNRERELPAPFLRRCLRLDISDPDDKKLARIVDAHFGEESREASDQRRKLIDHFMAQRKENRLVSTDQLLNAVYLVAQGIDVADRDELIKALMRDLNETERY